ncbi:MAG TPA: CAP domain-containing protein [Myxococcales bacterium]|nr:CAP domain-containing protein [Myxococcales bacterium]
MLLALLLVAAEALPPQARLERSLLEAVTGLCGSLRVTVDRDLTRACQDYAGAVRTGRAKVSGPAVAFFASLESAEPAPVAAVATVHPPSQADRAVGELFPKSCRFNRIGVAAAALPSGGAVVCALSALHATDLARIPGRVAVGGSVKVAGTLAGGLARPRLFVTRPSGAVDEIHLAAERGRFSATVAMKARGEHSIEVLADGPGGPQVVALRRVFAGVPPPSRPPPDPPAGAGLDGVEAAIAHLRASRGLGPLRRDPELDAAAEAHSKEMARLRTFAHVLPTDGGPSDRLRARGYAYSSVAENIGLSSDVGRAHEAIAGSPAHLANLLDPRHRRLGLGAARGPTADGPEGVYLTELFAVPVVGSKDPAGDVVRVIAGKRRALGLPPLARDPALDSLADHEVRATALSDQMKLDRGLTARALSQAPHLSSAAAELRVGSAPAEVGASKNIAEPRWTRLGVGALYASSRRYGPGRLWIVLLFAR